MVMKPQPINQKRLQGLGRVGEGNLGHRLFFPLPFQLGAVTWEERDGSSLLIHGSVSGVTTTALVWLFGFF